VVGWWGGDVCLSLISNGAKFHVGQGSCQVGTLPKRKQLRLLVREIYRLSLHYINSPLGVKLPSSVSYFRLVL